MGQPHQIMGARMWQIGWLVVACVPPDAARQRVEVYTEPLSEEQDADQDGIVDRDERRIETNPKRPDTDADGLDDGEELLLGLDPLDRDSDGDGLEDGEEVELGLDPADPDTDRGGRWDGDEILVDRDPFDPEDDGRATVAGAFTGGGGCDQGGSAPTLVATLLLPLLALRWRQR